jgi:ABC-type glycerol-3-phosphate transport system substrate-binding protein
MKAKWKFFIMAAVVLALAGCGKQEKEEGNTVTEYFKEAPVTMPEDIVGCLDFQYGEDGEYQAIGQDETKGVVLWSSSDQGKSWEEIWALPDQWKNSLVTEAQFTGDGGIFCVLAKDALQEGIDTPEASFAYLSPEGAFEEKKLSASQDGLSEIVCQNGLVYGRNTSGIVKAYDYKTGEEKKVYDQSGMFANQFVLTKERVIAIGIDKVEQYDLEDGTVLETSKKMNQALLKLASENQGYATRMCYDKNANAIYYVGTGGMFRYDMDKEEEKKMLYGEKHVFSDSKGYLSDVSVLDDQHVAISFIGQDRKAQVSVYSYEEKGHQVRLTTELKVYSLYENDRIRELANTYNSKQSKVHVKYECDITAENWISVNDAISRLNTRLAAGEGPDVILLDGLNEKAYIEQGLLCDVSDVLDKKEHYTNLALPYTREKYVYAIPLQFHLMTIHAEDDVTKSIGTLEELAGSLEAYHADHHGRATLERWETSNYMEVIFQTYFPELLKDGKLEEKELENFYKNLERIYNVSEFTFTDDDGSEDESKIDLSSLELMYNGEQEGLLAMKEVDVSISGALQNWDLSRLYYYGDVREGLTYDYFRRDGKPIFLPVNALAVMEDSNKKDIAKDFLAHCISYKEVMGSSEDVGFSINREAMKKAFAVGMNDTEEMENSKGETVKLPWKDLPKKEQKAFFELVDSLEEYSCVDQVVKEIVMKQAETYINHEGTLEECVASAVEKVNLYQQE